MTKKQTVEELIQEQSESLKQKDVSALTRALINIQKMQIANKAKEEGRREAMKYVRSVLSIERYCCRPSNGNMDSYQEGFLSALTNVGISVDRLDPIPPNKDS